MNVFVSMVLKHIATKASSGVSWLQSVFNDPANDLGSYVRVSGMFVIVNTIGMLWYSLVQQKDILPLAQSVLLALITSVLGSYIANKYAKPAVKAPKSKTQTPPTAPNKDANEEVTSEKEV